MRRGLVVSALREGAVFVVNLWPPESERWGCGTRLVAPCYGVPVYEDLILPNDFEGEWGGFDACARCFWLQGRMTEPVSLREFKAMAVLLPIPRKSVDTPPRL